MDGILNMATQFTPGQILAKMLSDSLSSYQLGSVVGDHPRSIIWGVTPKGSFVDGMTLDGFLANGVQILQSTDRVYRYGNSVVYETDESSDQRLTTLAVQHRAEPNAANILANCFGVGVQSNHGTVQSLPASRLVGAMLADEYLWRTLREIRYYGRRPTFDADFNLCKPGWNPASGILIHAPEVIPSSQAPAYTTDARAIDRLPPSLQALLREFSWRDDADVVNAVAVLLTGLLINHFVDDPHPAVIVDANQSGTGKTLLVQTFGRVLDDAEPPRISLVRDEELEKKLCAQLRSSRTSIFFLDNVRATIESMVLEANLLSPLLSFRILGRSATMERPNTYLWMVTSNMTSGTTDFIRRGVAIRQFFEGDPKSRKFSGNPLAYAARHRLEILGELAGMIVRWVEQGKPLGQQQHRCERWAEKIGGILDANGLGEFFLANASEAEMAMDQGLVDLATLAERVMGKGLGQLYVPADGVAEAKGLPPGLWVPVFLDTQILRDKLTESNNKGKATAVGIFLSGKRDRTVAIETSDGPRLATLRRRDASAGQKHYYFEIAIPEAAHSQEACGSIKASTEVLPTSSVDGPNQMLLSSGNGAGQTAQDSPPPSWTNANPTSGDGLPAAGEVEWV